MNYGEMFSPDGAQFKWNSHSIGAAERCLRYYNWTIIENWRRHDDSVHLIFGGHYAAALHHYFLSRAAGADREEAISSTVHFALVETWNHDLAEDGWRIPGTGGPWESDHTKNRFTLLRSLVWYFDQFEKDIPVLLLDGKPAVEQKFSISLDDDNLLVGTLDRVVDYLGTPWVMDQKTSGSTITQHYFSKFKPDMQMSAYTFAGRMIFDLPVRGVIIDAVQIAVGFSRFERGQTYRTDSELQEWYDSAMWWIETAQRATREHYFPANTSSCDLYGGCPFRRVCSASPESRKNFLASDFKQEVRV